MIFFVRNIAFVTAVPLSVTISPAGAAITRPPALTDHMILPQERRVPIDPNEAVTVTVPSQSKTVTSDAQDKWTMLLDQFKAKSTPHTLTISGSNTITLNDVLVGEVWVGQSNLDSPVNGYAEEDSILREAKSKSSPLLRLYHRVEQNGGQTASDPDLVGGYSVQLFYFGVLPPKEVNVPVGGMEGAVAGSPVLKPYITHGRGLLHWPNPFNADGLPAMVVKAAHSKRPLFSRKFNYENYAKTTSLL